MKNRNIFTEIQIPGFLSGNLTTGAHVPPWRQEDGADQWLAIWLSRVCPLVGLSPRPVYGPALGLFHSLMLLPQLQRLCIVGLSFMESQSRVSEERLREGGLVRGKNAKGHGRGFLGM